MGGMHRFGVVPAPLFTRCGDAAAARIAHNRRCMKKKPTKARATVRAALKVAAKTPVGPIPAETVARAAPDHTSLKARQRAERERYSENLSLRVHRALSWLSRAELYDTDPDAQFLHLWIAFNAAYATEIDEHYRLAEQETFRGFLLKLHSIDDKGRLEALVWKEFTKSIRMLLDNKFIFQDFWNYQNGQLPEDKWQARFRDANAKVKHGLGRRDTVQVLAVVLSRIYTLRNQLMHGGATWNSAVNREQLRDCCQFMGKLVPLVIEIMMDRPDTLWGQVCYPVIAAD